MPVEMGMIQSSMLPSVLGALTFVGGLRMLYLYQRRREVADVKTILKRSFPIVPEKYKNNKQMVIHKMFMLATCQQLIRSEAGRQILFTAIDELYGTAYVILAKGILAAKDKFCDVAGLDPVIREPPFAWFKYCFTRRFKL